VSGGGVLIALLPEGQVAALPFHRKWIADTAYRVALIVVGSESEDNGRTIP
jgi:hypothetical protein